MRATAFTATALVLANAVVWPIGNAWWTCLPWLLTAILIQRFLVED
jgi:hypothetical protein